jgi:hypothetical protein
MTRSTQFDYASVVERLRRAADNKQQRLLHGEKMRLGQVGAPRRRRVAPPPRPSSSSRLAEALRDEPRQLAAASLVLAGFAGWILSFAHTVYQQRVESSLASACHSNKYAYAGEVYCYDNRLVVHALKEDGSTTRPGLDWQVNERALRMAESEARVAALDAQ